MEIRDGRRWLSVLLPSAVNFAVIALMLGGWLFSLHWMHLCLPLRFPPWRGALP